MHSYNDSDAHVPPPFASIKINSVNIIYITLMIGTHSYHLSLNENAQHRGVHDSLLQALYVDSHQVKKELPNKRLAGVMHLVLRKAIKKLYKYFCIVPLTSLTMSITSDCSPATTATSGFP